MTSTSRTNASRAGRFVGDYFNERTYTQLDEGDPLNVKSLVELVEDFCVQLGFNSVYHVASLLTNPTLILPNHPLKRDTSLTQEFIMTNGLSRLLENVGNHQCSLQVVQTCHAELQKSIIPRSDYAIQIGVAEHRQPRLLSKIVSALRT
jgi:hypothetical protein